MKYPLSAFQMEDYIFQSMRSAMLWAFVLMYISDGGKDWSCGLTHESCRCNRRKWGSASSGACQSQKCRFCMGFSIGNLFRLNGVFNCIGHQSNKQSSQT